MDFLKIVHPTPNPLPEGRQKVKPEMSSWRTLKA